MTLDSFGLPHPAVVKNLKEYLSMEGLARRNMNISLPKGITAKGIPTQENYSDCGLYLLGYIRKFFEDPASFVRKVLMKEFDMEQDWGHLSPSRMRHEIRDLLQDLYKKGQGIDVTMKEKDLIVAEKNISPTANNKILSSDEAILQVHDAVDSGNSTSHLDCDAAKAQAPKPLAKSKTHPGHTVKRLEVDLTSEPEVEDSSDGTIHADEMLDKGGDVGAIDPSTGEAPLTHDWVEQLQEAADEELSRSPLVLAFNTSSLSTSKKLLDRSYRHPLPPERPKTRGKQI